MAFLQTIDVQDVIKCRKRSLLRNPKNVTFILQKEVPNEACSAPIFRGSVNITCQDTNYVDLTPAVKVYIQMGKKIHLQPDSRNMVRKKTHDAKLFDKAIQHVSEKLLTHNLLRLGRHLKLEQSEVEEMKSRYLHMTTY